MLNSNFHARKQNYFTKITQNFMIFSIALVVIISGISAVVLVARAYNGEKTDRLEQEQQRFDGSSFFLYLSLYGPFLPIGIYAALDIIFLLKRNFLESSYSDPNTEVKVLDPNTLPNLGQVSYCFLDKTGTLTKGDFEVKNINSNGKNYYIDAGLIKETLASRNTVSKSPAHKENLIVHPCINLETEMELGIVIHPQQTCDIFENGLEYKDKIGDNSEFVNDFLTEGSDSQLTELARCLALCHSCRTVKDIADGHAYEAPNPEDMAILRFAQLLHYEFEGVNRLDNPSVYRVREKNAVNAYNVLAVNEFSRRFSICFREPSADSDSPATLFVRGSEASMREKLMLDEHELETFNGIMARNTAQGYRTIVFAKRELSTLEADEFSEKYKNLKNRLENQDSKLEQLADEYESKLKLVGIVGMQDKTNPFALETLSTMREAGLNCWMLTGDTFEQALSTSYLLEFIAEQQDVHFLNASRHDETRAQIHRVLTSINKRINTTPSSLPQTENEDKNHHLRSPCVVISGEAWQTIIRDEYLLSNFAFICAVSSTVIGYMLTPKNKQEIVEMVKKRFPGRPITLGIGDGLKDALMMQTADISIEIADGKKHTTNAGDIRIKSLQVMKDLLLFHGSNFSQKIEISIILFFFKSYLLGFPIFFYNWYCSFTGTELIQSNLVFLYMFLSTSLPLIFLAVSNPADSPTDSERATALYMARKRQPKRIFQLFVFKAVFESLIQASIIFYMAIYSIQKLSSQDGLNSSLEIIGLEIFYGMTVISNIWVKKFSFLLPYQTFP